ncbi:MAG: dockerin type I domain-containing protein [Methanospirillum sp.]
METARVLARALPVLLACALATPVAGAALAAPPIAWEHLFGGDGPDIARSADRTTDGGYILLGETYSSASGDVAGTNHGMWDLWVVKLRGNGTVQWQRLLGGSRDDRAQAIRGTPDGGCIVLGTTFSNASGDIAGTTHGNLDTWVVKLDAAGGIQWQRLIGGDWNDGGTTIELTADGGYVLLGETDSSESGDVTVKNHGRSDVWVLKLDVGGATQWQRQYGGEYWETGTQVRQTADGGYLVTAGTQERNGVVSELYDVWLLRLDQNGLLLWEKILGGSGNEYGGIALPTADGGYLVAATTESSANGDVTPTNHGGYDVWVVRLDGPREVRWEGLYGGSGWDRLSAVRSTADGGCVLLGETDSSASGNVTGTNHGQNDLWTVKLGAGGAVEWQRLYGGDGNERAADLLQTADGGYLLLGTSTSSASGDVAAFGHGAEEVWAVRLDRGFAAVPGGVGMPTDTVGIGYCDDINGNGRADFADVVLYFNRMSWIDENEPISAFDYNGNGRIDFADVVLLFRYL